MSDAQKLPPAVEAAAGEVVAQIDAALYPAGLGLDRERSLRSSLVDLVTAGQAGDAFILVPVSAADLKSIDNQRKGAGGLSRIDYIRRCLHLAIFLLCMFAGCSSDKRDQVVDANVARQVLVAQNLKRENDLLESVIASPAFRDGAKYAAAVRAARSKQKRDGLGSQWLIDRLQKSPADLVAEFGQ